ncbi:GDSL-type esterase/lipase family protein [Clostridiaceae bacterium M8S5]|nr:GDSL-type esterase/lipase family protein [Clostridiaceae bacterium M8S5]
MYYDVQKSKRNIRRRKPRKRTRKLLFLFKCIFVISALLFISSSFLSSKNSNVSQASNVLKDKTSSTLPEIKDVNLKVNNVSGKNNEGVENNEKSNNVTSDDINSNKKEVHDVPVLKNNGNYDYSKKVSLNNSVDDSYFEKTLFIGNSRTEGLFLYSSPKGATFYTHEGLLVSNALTKKIIRSKGKKTKISISNALSANKNRFENIYVMFGTNELGWIYTSTFIDRYKQLINELKKYNPKANIYIQSILPVTSKKSNSNKIYTNQNIIKFNCEILKMCKDINAYYLDTFESVANSKGVLPDEASVDGVHLIKKYTDLWLDYIKTHTVM